MSVSATEFSRAPHCLQAPRQPRFAPAGAPAYAPPPWLPGGNLQTIWAALRARRFEGRMPPPLQRERWSTPDGDFIDVDWLQEAPLAADSAIPDARRTLVVLFHGLEGSSASHYAQAFAAEARARGLRYAIPHFRGCSGEINRAPRAYHSGDFEEMDWILRRMRARHAGPLVAVGVSLGGNALMRWAGEMGAAAAHTVDAVASVCAPLDLAAGGNAICRGFNRQVYNRMFLRTMQAKAQALAAQHPGLIDVSRLRAARDLHAFDDMFTAPLHGFRDVGDYWQRASARPHLARIRIPALALNARNDPFIPAESLPRPAEAGPCVTLWQPAEGGHVGFPRGAWPSDVGWLPAAVCTWLLAHAGQAHSP